MDLKVSVEVDTVRIEPIIKGKVHVKVGRQRKLRLQGLIRRIGNDVKEL